MMSQLGHVDAVNAGDDNVEFKMREDLISSHYQRRVTELTTNLQMADSKALHFYAEVIYIYNIYYVLCVNYPLFH